MDTPDRNRIGTPLSKFEDSPVFNYINSLSPIKPVKSINISQTFNSLSFAAIPSVFTSPHVKEFRPLGRHQSSDHCKYGNSSDNENRSGSSEVVTDAPLQRSPLGEASSESHNEHPKLCGGPDTNLRPCSSDDRDGVPELDGPSALHEKVTVQGKVHLQDIYQTQQKREEWESLISDAVDLLNFSSPDGTETLEGPFQKSNDPSTSFCTSLESEFPQDDFSDLHEQRTVPFSSDEQQEARDPSSELKEIEHERDNLADTSLGKCVTTNHGIKKTVDNAGKCLPFTSKPVSNLHRGMRRRCLLFEMPGGHRKNLKNASGGKIASNDKQVVTLKEHSETPSCILPGIGLHLNSLAATPKDHKTAKHEIMATGNHLAIVPISTASFSSASINQETTTMSLDLVCSERDKDPNENKAHVAEDTLQASAHTAIVESNQSSPKKKRRKFEQAGETEACKRCNCKKSKCLKLYCECFAAGVYCVEPCSCQDCFNKPIHEDTVLSTRKQIESRNPLAFAPKVVRTSDSGPEIGDEPNTTPASARHKRGCNCKKSSCLKKYCECYQGGVGCSVSCRCEGCKNAFGRKDGYASLGTDADREEEETEPDSALPMTPLQIRRPSAQLPFSSRRKPPRSSFLSSGLSSVLGKRNFLPPEPKFEKHFRSNAEDEMPHILRGDTSPSSGIKTASPNSKRVSPPHCDYESSSPSRRSTRKLILRSIPSFPSLTQN